MAWEDVKSKLKFYGPEIDPVTKEPTNLDGMPTTVNGIVPYGDAFEPSDKDEILDALEEIYNSSPEGAARALLETGNGDIWLMASSIHSYTRPGATRTLAIDMSDADTYKWMGSDGRIKTDNVGGHVIHELIHAIYGMNDLVDPTSFAPLQRDSTRDYENKDFDFLGDTVRLQNRIFSEAGFGAGYKQVGYDANIRVAPEVFSHDVAYTEGKEIDIAHFDNPENGTPNVLDLSKRTDNSRDLIIGLAGNDRINGGAGRDYLYGGC
jgi:hypothetical protein